jgi:hypothetical protein
LPETKKRFKKLPSSHRGTFSGGGKKVTVHTTEGGTSARGIANYLRDVGYEVHFVCDPIHKRVIQVLPLNVSGFGLEHPSGPETNRANNVQIELVAFASESTAREMGYNKKWAVANWGEDEYQFISVLLAKIHRRHPFSLRCPSFRHPRKMSGTGFYNYSGLVGHVHVPGNNHSDPGTSFRGRHLLTLTKRRLDK